VSVIRLQPANGDPVSVSVVKWSDNGRVMLTINGDKHEAEVLRYREGRGTFRLAGKIVRFRGVRTGKNIQTRVENRDFEFQLVADEGKRRAKQSAAAKKELTAPMPGTVLRIHLSKGNAFQAHQPIIILESMKMELTLTSPTAGTIREVLCKEGELVPLGHVLARLDFGDES